MTTIIHRSWLVNMGSDPPPELAYVVSDHPGGLRVVTWADVIEERRKRQRQRLEQLREGNGERAYKLWVGYFDQAIFGGWHAFLDTYGGPEWNSHTWIDRDRKWLCSAIMDAFPLLLPLWTEDRLWERWKVAFARRFARRRQCHRPLGVAYVWWDGRHGLRAIGRAGSRPRSADASLSDERVREDPSPNLEPGPDLRQS